MDMRVSEKSGWVLLSFLGPLKYSLIARILPFAKDIRELFSCSLSQLRALGFSDDMAAALHSPDWKRLETHLRWEEDPQHHILTLGDKTYPPLLREIATPPWVLFLKGDPQVLIEAPCLGVVGSRRPSALGRHQSYEFSRELGKRGWVVVSGLAEGIDGMAHEGTLEEGGKTVAVLGTGLDRIYPSHHEPLAQRIVAQGALVSEFPLHTILKPHHFPQRNRLISGLSRGVLVVEAALRSGSLITARHALEQNREVFAIPGSIYESLRAGCHGLIKEGAQLAESVEDIIRTCTSLDK